MKNGVPWDVAMSMDPGEAIAIGVVFARFENGRDFDWERGRWKENPDG